MSKIELGKTYRTRDGREVRIYAVDAGGAWTVHGAFLDDNKYWNNWAWREDGRQGTGHDHFTDLIEVKPRIKREVWVNVYPLGELGSGASCVGYASRSKADDAALKMSRIACVKLTIDCEEGEGL